VEQFGRVDLVLGYTTRGARQFVPQEVCGVGGVIHAFTEKCIRGADMYPFPSFSPHHDLFFFTKRHDGLKPFPCPAKKKKHCWAFSATEATSTISRALLFAGALPPGPAISRIWSQRRSLTQRGWPKGGRAKEAEGEVEVMGEVTAWREGGREWGRSRVGGERKGGGGGMYDGIIVGGIRKKARALKGAGEWGWRGGVSHRAND